jgi:hypothetical protein
MGSGIRNQGIPERPCLQPLLLPSKTKMNWKKTPMKVSFVIELLFVVSVCLRSYAWYPLSHQYFACRLMGGVQTCLSSPSESSFVLGGSSPDAMRMLYGGFHSYKVCMTFRCTIDGTKCTKTVGGFDCGCI